MTFSDIERGDPWPDVDTSVAEARGGDGVLICLTNDLEMDVTDLSSSL